jgi:hypothetical protein
MKTDTICADMSCDRNVAERPRYYARQLITSVDLTLEQDYFRNKLRLHNRLLHGWGVVCGAQVCLVPQTRNSANGNGNGGFEPWLVYVKPGYILSPCGDEINIDCGRVVDLRKSGVTGITGEPCVEVVDPWCVEVFDRDGPDTLWLAVRYKQYATRPVRVQPVGCGCDDTRCENSRWRDGYEIKVLNYCPHEGDEKPHRDDLFHGPTPPCPTPADDPWVGLARIELDADGVISRIDNCACRRLVMSLGDAWWQCESAPEIEIVEGGGDIAPGEGRSLTVEANRAFPVGTEAHLGSEVTINQADVKLTEKRLEVPFKVELNAVAGPRALKIDFPDQQRVVKRNAINVKESGTKAPPPSETKTPSDTKTPSEGTRKPTRKPTRDTARFEDTQPDIRPEK